MRRKPVVDSRDKAFRHATAQILNHICRLEIDLGSETDRKIDTDEFARLRIGIGRPPGKMDPMDYVLKRFPKNSKSDLDLVLKKVVDSIEVMIVDGIEKAMSLYNHPILLDG